MAQMRLDRFLAEEGVGTRSEVKKLVRSGRVRVNGTEVRQPAYKIDPEKDSIEAEGRAIGQTGFLYLMMNKPGGVLSATRDGRTQTVISLVQESWANKLFPAGRLDKDTEGFVLLTNDGMLAHRLLSPRRHVSKTYFAIVSGIVTENDVRLFREGLDIGEKRKTLPAQLVRLTVDGDFLEEKINRQDSRSEKQPPQPDSPLLVSRAQMQEFCMRGIALSDYARCGEGECCVAVAVTEGKFHQIKRMFEAVGREVRFLKRIAIGTVCLDRTLESGQYRPLTEEELGMLRNVEGSAEAPDDNSEEQKELCSGKEENIDVL